MVKKLTYAEIVKKRQDLPAEDDRYATLGEAGLKGCWVSPPQKTSRSCTGPVLVAHNFLDFERAKKYKDCILNAGGYLPWMPFNGILDCALTMAGMNRSDIYITQALHFLPKKGAPPRPPKDLLCRSFCEVTRHEIRDRRVIALGGVAKDICRMWVDKHGGFELIACLLHPSAAGDPCDKAKELAKALKKADGR